MLCGEPTIYLHYFIVLRYYDNTKSETRLSIYMLLNYLTTFSIKLFLYFILLDLFTEKYWFSYLNQLFLFALDNFSFSCYL